MGQGSLEISLLVVSLETTPTFGASEKEMARTRPLRVFLLKGFLVGVSISSASYTLLAFSRKRTAQSSGLRKNWDFPKLDLGLPVGFQTPKVGRSLSKKRRGQEAPAVLRQRAGAEQCPGAAVAGGRASEGGGST